MGELRTVVIELGRVTARARDGRTGCNGTSGPGVRSCVIDGFGGLASSDPFPSVPMTTRGRRHAAKAMSRDAE